MDPQNDRSGGLLLTAEVREMLETYRAWRQLVEAMRAVLVTAREPSTLRQ
jgi:hypothetical protein